MKEVSRPNDMWPDVVLHMDKNDKEFKLRITWKENTRSFLYDWREVQFCTLRWGWHSLETLKASRKLYECLKESPNQPRFRQLKTADQVFQLLIEEDGDVILSFPLWLWKIEREIKLDRNNLSSEENEALDELYNAMEKDSKKWGDKENY